MNCEDFQTQTTCSIMNFNYYKRESCELTGKYDTTIGAPFDDFEFLLSFPIEAAFTCWLLASSETCSGDDGKKQLKMAEKRTILCIGLAVFLG
ncbi:hypothetical protein CsSME_00011653 [Camellia sinensis var. sinensis]